MRAICVVHLIRLGHQLVPVLRFPRLEFIAKLRLSVEESGRMLIIKKLFGKNLEIHILVGRFLSFIVQTVGIEWDIK